MSRHLRVLRDAGLVDVRQDVRRWIDSLRPEALVEVDEWLRDYRALCLQWIRLAHAAAD